MNVLSRGRSYADLSTRSTAKQLITSLQEEDDEGKEKKEGDKRKKREIMRRGKKVMRWARE
jgi:hypothetical protein